MKLPFQGNRESTREPVPEGPPPPDATVVLMVDDEPAQRQLFSLALRREGYHVLEARNGVEALDVAAAAGRLDLAITDIMMPIMRGPELAQNLREQYPGLKIIFVSGYMVTEDLGPEARVMQKPFVRQDLLKQVVELIGRPKAAPPS